MEDRIKLIYGDRDVIDIDNFVLINKVPMVNIFKKNNEIVLIVYGELICSVPTISYNIKITKKSQMFSAEADVLNYIKTGIKDSRIADQIEIYNIARVYLQFGKKIKEKVSEIEDQVNCGKKTMSISCIPEIMPAIRNYVIKNYTTHCVIGAKTIDIDI